MGLVAAAGTRLADAVLSILIEWEPWKAARVYHPHSMPYKHFDVFYCRSLTRPTNEVWPRAKNWH